MGASLVRAVEERAADVREEGDGGKGKGKGKGNCGWRALMGATRDAARTLVRRKLLTVTLRDGVEVGADEAWRGPCRFRLRSPLAEDK